MEIELLKWGFQQGALTIVILLLLFYIRKRDQDFKVVLEANNEALSENAKSNNQISMALDAQTRAVDTHTDALQVLLYGIKRNKAKLGGVSKDKGTP